MTQTSSETPAGVAKPSLLRRPRVRLALCLLALAALGTGVAYYVRGLSFESTDDAFIESHVVAVTPRVSGHVASVLVADNQQVRQGDVLVELDPADYQAALDAALAKEAAARADVAEAQAQVSAARSRLAQARADLASQQALEAEAEADVDQAAAGHTRDAGDLDRMRSLAETGAVSSQQLDHAVAAEAVSRAELDSADRRLETQAAKVAEAQAAIDACGDTLRQTQAHVESCQAELQKAGAETEQARLNLSYTRVVAPCDGFVARKSVEPGAYVQPGQAMFSLVQQQVWVVANFKETQLTHMRPGQCAEITVDAYPGATFNGFVESIQRGTGSRFSLLPAENASGNFVKVVQRVPVKIVFDRDEDLAGFLLTPGMSVVLRVDVSQEGGGEPLAESAVLSCADRP